ncbi:hypothetical protein Acsp05_23710 [Actinokineospora sp. NBRC 105648]|nr:hypothetical protein Acsp05_23710 [Actinokineospora sp. NBRC 105648]
MSAAGGGQQRPDLGTGRGVVHHQQHPSPRGRALGQDLVVDGVGVGGLGRDCSPVSPKRRSRGEYTASTSTGVGE